METTAVYLQGMRLPVDPAQISYTLKANSRKVELVGAGQAEILKGAELAQIEMEGFLPAQPRYYTRDWRAPATYIEQLQRWMEQGEPIRAIYIGSQGWELNLLCSVAQVYCQERGGSADIDYVIALRKWVDVSPRKSSRPAGVQNQENTSAQTSYTVQEGDCLSHIAQALLGEQSRWREIYALNKDQIKNPNLIYAGQQLLMPEGADLTATPIRRTPGSSPGKNSAYATTQPTGGQKEPDSKYDKLFSQLAGMPRKFVSAEKMEEVYGRTQNYPNASGVIGNGN